MLDRAPGWLGTKVAELATEQLIEPIACFVCGVAPGDGVALLRCSRCKVAWYCSAGHQREHWPEHKGECGKDVRRAAPSDTEDPPQGESDRLAILAARAASLSKQGLHLQAETVYREVIDLATRDGGADHPDTLAAMENLGFCLLDQERSGEAEAIQRDVQSARARGHGWECGLRCGFTGSYAAVELHEQACPTRCAEHI